MEPLACLQTLEVISNYSNVEITEFVTDACTSVMSQVGARFKAIGEVHRTDKWHALKNMQHDYRQVIL